MQIDLFVCTAERNRVNKNNYITNRFTMDGTLKKSTSAMNVVIDVQKTNPVKYNYNYMYIQEFNRFYFIDDITCVTDNIWTITASVDVLMSFQSDILSTRSKENSLIASSAIFLNGTVCSTVPFES